MCPKSLYSNAPLLNCSISGLEIKSYVIDTELVHGIPHLEEKTL